MYLVSDGSLGNIFPLEGDGFVIESGNGVIIGYKVTDGVGLAHPVAAVQALHFVPEGVDVFEAAIDGSEADVGHLIEIAQRLHDQLTAPPGLDLALTGRAQTTTDTLDRRLDLLVAHGSLLERLAQTASQLVLVEGLAPIVALDDRGHGELRALEGREPLAATLALASPSNLHALTGETGIDDPRLRMTTEGAVHRRMRRRVRRHSSLLQRRV